MRGTHADFSSSVERLIRGFLAVQGVRHVDVASRVKDRSSLEAKIARKGHGRYKSLSDITDVCGVRVITYFEGDVKRVADIVEREFDVDRENSVDKSTPGDPDRFGYRSVHYVATLGKDRTALSEYSLYAGFKIEIQIRSILQHAWAEIEHDIGYKSAEAVPLIVKRRFSRLAGLLELADEEFMTIRRELDEYGRELPSRLAAKSDEVSIDAESFFAFINSDATVRAIDEEIARSVDAPLRALSKDNVSRRVAQLHTAGLKSIGELRTALQQNHDHVIEVANRWLHRDPVKLQDANWHDAGMPYGISTFYLAYTLLLKKGDPDAIVDYMYKYFHDANDLVKDMFTTFDDFIKNAE
ncbi:GTP pyrophosphokinase [Burkholderia metallica]|uniref:GTP pyrophosphokinase n=1 Tax=Burkholderia metallica TaxID=488729 RepID=UPI0020C64F25|nr:hypothetical protein [Burkholderia metallica]